eukprot:jgi/Ulvmu1/2400/UM133_0001.1
MKPPLLLCLTIGLIVVHRWRKRKRSRDLHKIPLGPGSLPVIGHVSILKVFLGTEQIAPLDALEDTMEQVTAVAAHPLHYQLLRRGLLPGYRRYRRNWQALHDYHCELAREAYARPMPDDCTAFWATVRRAFPAALTDAHELEHAAAHLSLYMAAYETTAAAVTHTLAALALDQDSQTALAEELREAGLLAEPGRPPPRAIARDDLARMTVLGAVCHESLRLLPPSPVGGLRELGKDTKIGGYMVPKGTALIIPPCALHACEHAWGPDAGEWRPDRWLEGRSIAAAKMTANGHPRFLAFFGGTADCIGQHLAVVELKLVVASLIGRLHITVDQQLMPYMQSVSDYVAATVMSVNLHCDGPCWLRMRPRSTCSGVDAKP